ncbi:unnamed protein product [Allacma fusca]|uniref:Uncharacterized protein n=1 Tax=Allacma fusca TaxID=39272 RepID=A0A8J2K4Q7_9HEXA|nr:unnamed protein product [Allacma fusca]
MKKWGILFVLSITVLPSFAQITYTNSLASPLTLSIQQDTSNPGSYYVIRPQHLLPSPYTAQQSQLISAVLDSNRQPASEVNSVNTVSGNTLQLSPVSVGRINPQSQVSLTQPVNVVKYTLVRSSSTLAGGYRNQPRQEITEDQETIPEAEEDDVEDLSPSDIDETVTDEENNDGPAEDEEEAEDEDESQAEAPVARPVKPTRPRGSSSKKETSRARSSTTAKRPKKIIAQAPEEVEDEGEDPEDEAVEEEETTTAKPQARRRTKSKSKQGVRSGNGKERSGKSRSSSREEIGERVSPKLKYGVSRTRTTSSSRKQTSRSQTTRKSKQSGRARKPQRAQDEESQNESPSSADPVNQGGYSISPATVETIAPGDSIDGSSVGGANIQLATISPESQNQVLSNLITTLQRTAPITSISTSGASPSQLPSPAGASPASTPAQVSALSGGYSSPQQNVPQQIQSNTRQPLQQGSPSNLNSGGSSSGLSSSPSLDRLVDSERDYRVVPALSYEVANGNYIVPSLDNGSGELIPSSQQANPNQIRSQYQTQSPISQQNSINQNQYGAPIQNQGQQISSSPQFGGQNNGQGSPFGGQSNGQGSQFGGQSNGQGSQFGGQINGQGPQFQNNGNIPSVQYGVPSFIDHGGSNNGQYGFQGQSSGQGIQGNPNSNQGSIQFGDNGITNQRPVQSDGEFSDEYEPPNTPVATMTVRFSQNANSNSNPLVGVENPDAFSMPQSSQPEESVNNAIPQNTLREAINLVAMFAQSQVSGQNVVGSQNGVSTQFSVSPSQVFIPTEEAAEDIFRDPVPNIRNIQLAASDGNSGNDNGIQNSQSGYNNQQYSQQNVDDNQLSQQQGYSNQQSTQNGLGNQQQSYSNQQSAQNGLGNQQQSYSSQESSQNIGGNQQQSYGSPQSSQNGLGNQQQQSYSNQRSSSQLGLGSQQSQIQQQGYSNQPQSSQTGSGNQQSQIQQQGYRSQQGSSQNVVGNQQSQGSQQQSYRSQQRVQSPAARSQQDQIQQIVYRNQQSSQQAGLGNQQSQGYRNQQQSSQVDQELSEEQPNTYISQAAQSSRAQPQPAYGSPISTDSGSEVTKVTGLSLAYPNSKNNQQPAGTTSGRTTQTIFRTISNLLTRSYRP